jgi:two-component system chemotaxis sensor kinase CheA
MLFPASPSPRRKGAGPLSDLLDLSELFGDFRDEGRAQLARLDGVLSVLESGTAPDEAQRAELLRALHTLKGNAAMLGLRPLQELVHGVEDAFKRAAVPAALPLDVLARTGAALRRALEAAGSPEQEAAFAPLPQLRGELAAALSAAETAAAAVPPPTEQGSADGSPSGLDAGEDQGRAADRSASSAASGSGAGEDEGRAADGSASSAVSGSGAGEDGGRAADGSASSAASGSGAGEDEERAADGSASSVASGSGAGEDGERAADRSASSAVPGSGAGEDEERAADRSASSAVSGSGAGEDGGRAADGSASSAVTGSDGPAGDAGRVGDRSTSTDVSVPADAESAADARTPAEAAPQPAPSAGAREETLRIPLGRLDPLLSQVDDLSRAVEGLRAWAAERSAELQEAGVRRALAERLEELDASAATVRRSATALRLVPVERVFSRFPPLAADLARERGKRVRVILRGEGTELDKATADALLDPLLHLVRNAVDHGVEPPEARRAAGKPETATIVLSAAQEGDRVRIEVEDDGRGLDRAGMELRARELGLIEADENADPEALDDLLFRPGFSTRREADEVSGRGVGLDVVRDAVERLRGQVRVEEGDEGGTRFVLTVPLTVALVPVLFFQAAGETFAIPALDVEETVRAAAPGRVGPAETVAVRDESVPLVRLDRLFGWSAAPDPRFVLVLRRGARAAALGADRLLAQDAAPVRALPGALGGPRGVSGAVVDARGRVVLLLDPGQLLEMNVDLYRGGPGGG